MAQDVISKSRNLSDAEFILKKFREQLDEATIKAQNPWLTLPEACKFLNVGETTLWTYRKQGKIRASKINRKLYFKRTELEKLIESNQIKDCSGSAGEQPDRMATR